MRRAAAGVLLLGAVLAMGTPGRAQSTSISGSGHDLSVSGPGPVVATTERQVCIFCHASHAAKPAVPLWNHTLSSISSYSLYTSSTYVQNNPLTISERSKLCLSCHDGTVAMGQTVANGLIATTGSLASKDILGSGNLSSDHPFGFVMPAVDDGEIKRSLIASPPTTSDPAVKLYNSAIECVTCHEPHDPNRDTAVQFMVRSNIDSALCTACHDTTRGVLAGWNSGAHAAATNTVAYGSGLPYTNPSTVATNACASCHTGHNAAGTGARLLRGIDASTCTTCHGSIANVTPALSNIMGEFNKPYAHPVFASVGAPHDPAETIPVTSSRHSQCPDCHNPHTSQLPLGSPTPPALEPSLNGASGVSAADGLTVLRPAANQYEICFKCHANSNNKPQNANYSICGRTPYRLTYPLLSDPYNIRLDLQSSVARHNVTQPSRGSVAPSLRLNMLDLSGNPTGKSLQGGGSYLYCTDCHNSDSARNSGGMGPNGPHGSSYFHLLERRYEYDALPGIPGGSTAAPSYMPGPLGPYAICDKCHDLDHLLLSQVSTADTVFHQHYTHVVLQNTACSTCHSAHGVQGGTVINNAHLVNFDRNIVGPDDKSRLYLDTSARACYLTCHGVLHNPKTY